MFQPEFLKFCKDFDIKVKSVMHLARSTDKHASTKHEAINKEQLIKIFNRASNRTNKISVEGFESCLKTIAKDLHIDEDIAMAEQNLWQHMGLLNNEWRQKTRIFGQKEAESNVIPLKRVKPIANNNRLVQQSERYREKQITLRERDKLEKLAQNMYTKGAAPTPVEYSPDKILFAIKKGINLQEIETIDS